MGQARLCPPTLEQWGAARAVHTPKEYFAEVLTEYQARRDAAISALTAIPGVTAFPPGGAFYTIARLPIDDGDAFCRWLLEEFQHEGETVMMAPAAGFYATEGLGLDEVRIAFVLDVASMGRAMEILRLALAAYPGRRA
jgi:aspartate aminotransferase